MNTPMAPPRKVGSKRELEQVLVDGLMTRQLDREAVERVRAAALQVWETSDRRIAAPVRSARAQWGLWAGLTAAAAVLAAAVIRIEGRTGPSGDMLGSVARVSDGGIEVTEPYFRSRSVAPGGVLHAGDTLITRGTALIMLARGGTLRLARDTKLVIESASGLQLEKGLMYCDIPVGSSSSSPLRVTTRAGLVEHMGTEFEILSDDHQVRIRVREGQIRFASSVGVLLAEAGTELLSSTSGDVSRRPAPTYGPDWQWTTSLAPDYALEGRLLYDYLSWISRELGRPLVFADPVARDKAGRAVLHGSMQNPATLDALEAVLSSTSLTYELSGGAIRIHSER